MTQEEINKLPHEKIDKYLDGELKIFRQRCTIGLLSDAEYMRIFLKRLAFNVHDIIHEEPNDSVKIDPNKLQAECDAFNAKYPVGTPVLLKKDFIDEPVQTVVRHPAYVLSGHSAVAFFDGVSGCYAIKCVKGKII